MVVFSGVLGLVLALAASATVIGCDVFDLDERDRSCPCGDGFVCCAATNRCIDSETAKDCDLKEAQRPTNVVHAECQESPDSVGPYSAEPLDLDINGRPLFDYWRDFDGNDFVARANCVVSSQAGCDPGDRCIDIAGAPLCVPIGGLEGYCDGGQSPITGADEFCIVCAPPQTRAAACTLGYETDCRPWPYASTSGVNQFCSIDDDCEIGLVCSGRPAGAGYGVCRCPDFGFGSFPTQVCEET